MTPAIEILRAWRARHHFVDPAVGEALNAVLAGIEAVLALHAKGPLMTWRGRPRGGEKARHRCMCGNVAWPCPTRRALTGERP